MVKDWSTVPPLPSLTRMVTRPLLLTPLAGVQVMRLAGLAPPPKTMPVGGVVTKA